MGLQILLNSRFALFLFILEETVKTWVDLGAGCCSDRRNNALFTGDVEDLDACKKKCLDNGARCKFVEYGWKDSNWCYVVSADAGCENLLNGHNDCGSAGNDGVHSFEAIYQGIDTLFELNRFRQITWLGIINLSPVFCVFLISIFCNVVSWKNEATDAYCPDNLASSDVSNQYECQQKCEAADICVGITYSYKSISTHWCYVCLNDGLSNTGNEFGFYRRPVGKKNYNYKYIVLEININLYMNIYIIGFFN